MATKLLPGPGDDEIIEASLADPARFGEIFDRHFSGVLAYVRRRVGVDAAGEIVAEAFTRGFEHRARYVAGGHGARPWLLGIATNLVRDHGRAEARQLRGYTTRDVGVQDGADRADERLDAQATARVVADAIRTLPRKQRDVLLLYAWCDLTPNEIAGALGVPAGTVRSLLSRARVRLAAVLGADEPNTDRTAEV